MHTYLRAVGFSNIHERKDLDKLIGEIMTRPTCKYEHPIKGKERFLEITKDYADGVGVTLRGYYDDKGFFHLDHYFPHLKPRILSVEEKVYLNKRVENSAYNVLCDEMQLGVALVFYLINAVDYMNLEDSSRYFVKDTKVCLSGLSVNGTVILPVKQDEKMLRRRNKQLKIKQRLIQEARNGNQSAIDNLTMNDIDTHAKISKRTKYQDIYTIVENSFYPSGSGTDCYSMIGTIRAIQEVVNGLTKEEIYKFIVECNNVLFSVCINKNDLLGVPSVGARFKGDLWLQGYVQF
jgi:hypothetical protein